MHSVVDLSLWRQEDRRLAISASSSRQCGSLVRSTTVARDYRPESECFVQAVLEVLAAFQICERDVSGFFVGAEGFDDRASKLRIDLWVAQQ